MDGRGKAEAEAREDPLSARAFGDRLIAGMTMWVLLLTLGVAVGFDPPGGDDAAATVLGVTETLLLPGAPPAAPEVTTTTVNALVEYWATTTTTTAPPSTTSTTTTTAPPPTTTTAPPAPIAAASATATDGPVTLLLDVRPAAEGRSLEGQLTARFEDLRVLRAVRVDYGDGTVLDVEVPALRCNDPAAPERYELPVPVHAYGAAGTYPLTVVATTATCSPDDDDWDPFEERSEVSITLVAP